MEVISVTDAIIHFFRETLNNDILTIFIISMIPIIELRGSIPVAIGMGMEWYAAFGWAFLGSMVVVPILLLILMPILNAMKKVKFFNRFANFIENMFKSKAESITKKLGQGNSAKREMWIKMIGVLTFVALPIPLTGVWTGTAIAIFLGLGFWRSLAVVAIGNVSAGLIMTGLSVLLQDKLDLFLTIFFVVVAVAIVANIIYMVIKKKKAKKASAQENIAKDSLECEQDNNGESEVQNSESENQNNQEEETKINTNSEKDLDKDPNMEESLTAKVDKKDE